MERVLQVFKSPFLPSYLEDVLNGIEFPSHGSGGDRLASPGLLKPVVSVSVSILRSDVGERLPADFPFKKFLDNRGLTDAASFSGCFFFDVASDDFAYSVLFQALDCER